MGPKDSLAERLEPICAAFCLCLTNPADAVRPTWQGRSPAGNGLGDEPPIPSQAPSPFKRFNSSPEVIRLVVLMYVRFPLSLRNVEDLRRARRVEGAGQLTGEACYAVGERSRVGSPRAVPKRRCGVHLLHDFQRAAEADRTGRIGVQNESWEEALR